MEKTMLHPTPKSSAIRKLLNEQNTDVQWLFEASKLLKVNAWYLKDPLWDKTFWDKTWGQIERINTEEVKALAWHRPDYGTPLYNSENIPDNIKLVKFALMAILISALKNENQLSFVKVGEGVDWMRAKVFYKEKELNHVVEADALLGHAVVIARDGKGKPVLDKAKGELVHHVVKGPVTITLMKDTQTLF